MKPTKKPSKSRPDKSQPLLRQLAAVPAKLFSGAFRQQYGALCFRYCNAGSKIEILVITSRERARWVVPKGWPMKGKKPFEAAAIEAWEEAGVRGAVKRKPVGRYTYLKELDDGDVAPCIVDLFQIEVTKIENDFKEQGQRILQWVSPDEAARRVREVELKSLLVEFRPRGQRKFGLG
ncbi:NUDIX hydrolase [Rhizobium binae]|uniref:NUDIX hydrolase n=1 Tax=Rhizobium binae TaxID=1138190 RepID=UPI001C82840E|nr:NUDIX hydrolase [Rhizobium binae]MBX4935965.1 NUDIX hydrolase [Rhizobium binae]MBX4942004.1 NUDIX hydrolase [Rhizobium binae]MBX4961966.1 NUDIX hydrolase [Rhizobium binae]MBX4977894.1 NUDIX hydrolase [Rhizobium binae]